MLSESSPRNPTGPLPPQTPGRLSAGVASPSYAIYFTPLSNWICRGSTMGLYGQTLLSARPSGDVASSQNGAFHAGAKGQCQAFLRLVSVFLAPLCLRSLEAKLLVKRYSNKWKTGILRAAIRYLGKSHLLQSGGTSNICPHRPRSVPCTGQALSHTASLHTPWFPAKITRTHSRSHPGVCSQESGGYSQLATKKFFEVNFFS